MMKILKRLALGLLVGLALLIGFVVYGFTRNIPIQDGLKFGPRVSTVRDGMVSAFMLDTGDGGVALIDAGNDPQGKAILEELSRRNLTPSAVKAIFLTHGHSDHIAACAKFPSAQIYALAAEVPLTEGKEAARGLLPRMFGPNKLHLQVSHPLQDGVTITVGNLPVQVFAVPGHTAGSAAYLADGVLFLGDSASARKDGALVPAVGIFSDNAEQNHAALKALAARLQASGLHVDTLAFAHSGPLPGLRPLLDYAAQN
jgi:glyoxylase-like metal-dependent hydrolase (beta-lactamase superfamily II)